MPLDFFKRDPVHANAEGEAVLARILEQYFAPRK
jgi:lysophospholipase L1-like esterase